MNITHTKRNIILALVAVFTLFLYRKILGFEFVNFDDPGLVFNNPVVRFPSIKALFFDLDREYLPLTFGSFAIEHFFFGFDAKYFHLNNLILHIANSVLVYFLAIKLSNKKFFVALLSSLLFAIHPLHVESVTWISERKDVLSALFTLFSLLFYIRYLEKKGSASYHMSLVSFVMALMAKFMAVTTPFLLFLCDWVLNKKSKTKDKIPYFTISAVFTLIHLGYHHSLSKFQDTSVFTGIKTGLDSITFYLSRSLIPTRLSVFYEYGATQLGANDYIFAILILALLTMAYNFKFGSRQVLLFGAAFFILTIAPVLKIIPFNNNAPYADRFFYFPSIGIFLIFTSIADYLLSKGKNIQMFTAAAIGITLTAFSFLTYQRNEVWKNSETLWTDSLKNYPNSSTAHGNLGVYYFDLGKYDKALPEYIKALEINPNYAEAHHNMGSIYLQNKMFDEAEKSYLRSCEIEPTAPRPHINLGLIYRDEKKYDEAIKHLEAAIPQDQTGKAFYNLGLVYSDINEKEKALKSYLAAIEINPEDWNFRNNLGALYFSMQKYELAREQYQKVLALNPNNADVLSNLGVLYAEMGQFEKSLSYYDQALRLNPTRPEIIANRNIAAQKNKKAHP